MIVDIKADEKGPGLVIKPRSFLGSSLFNAYRMAIAGAKFDANRKCNVAEPKDIANVLRGLRDAGFEAQADDAARARIGAVVQTTLAAVGASEGRLSEIEGQSGRTFYSFQREGVKWLSSRRTGLLADSPGLGKTSQALSALPENAPVLVVCPAVAKGVWKREANTWRKDYKTVTVLSGRGSFRYPAPGEIVVINYDLLSDNPGDAPESLVLIGDEIHMCKGSKTARTKRWNALRDAAIKANGYAYGLTGTPLLNRPQELFSVLSSVDCAREAFGTWDNFVHMVGGYRDQYGYKWQSTLSEEKKEAIGNVLKKVVLVRRKEDVLKDLPAKRWQTINVEIDAKAKTLCDKLYKEMAEELGIELNEESIANFLKKNADISFEKMSRARAVLATAKMSAMLEIVEQYEENDEPLVVFSAHRMPIDELGKRDGWAVITGDTSNEERTRIENDFQAGKLKGVGATIKAGGVAITLTRASNLLFVDKEWTPALNLQAEDRIHRISQDFGVLIMSLVADHPLDERIAALIDWKKTLIKNTVEQAVRDENYKVDVQAIADVVSLVSVAAPKSLVSVAAPKSLQEPELRPGRRWGGVDEQEALKAIQEMLARGVVKGINRSFAESLAGQSLNGLTDRQWTALQKLVHAVRKQLEAEAKAAEAARVEALPRRQAQNETEQWAAQAVVSLDDMNDDRAQEGNGVGFNKGDTSQGARFAARLRNGQGLNDVEWVEAAKMCRKYHRQVGRAPGG